MSIKRLVMASLVFVLLLPITFFVYSLFQNSWEQVEQRMVEKHHLISRALVEPFTLFISTRQQALNTLGQELLVLDEEQKIITPLHSLLTTSTKEQRVQRILDKHLNSFGNFVALSYSSHSESEALECISSANANHENSKNLNYSSLNLHYLPSLNDDTAGRDLLSPVFRSSLSDKPVILIKHDIFDRNQLAKGTVFAEISLEQVDAMCSRIDFGVKGHCALVDNTGHILSHPNKSWVKDIRDISKVSVVQQMMAGESGTTEFYSPFLKQDMVAGFSPIPALGWGVMIPQPKSELTKTLDDARFNTLIWMLVGVAVALVVSVLLTRKVTKPINLLIRLTNKSDKEYEAVNIGQAPKDTPSEIKQLWASFANLLSGLQRSNAEIKRLNMSLQGEIQLATKELQAMNKNLYIISSQDYLTSISNRRHFTQYLTEILKNNVKENVGIIMIDVDKFKHLNDHYGHEAGDLALKHLSGVLKRSIRHCDLVARLGGDEFIVYIQNLSDEELAECGERIRSSTEQNPLVMDSQIIPFTLSIGILNPP